MKIKNPSVSEGAFPFYGFLIQLECVADAYEKAIKRLVASDRVTNRSVDVFGDLIPGTNTDVELELIFLSIERVNELRTGHYTEFFCKSVFGKNRYVQEAGLVRKPDIQYLWLNRESVADSDSGETTYEETSL